MPEIALAIGAFLLAFLIGRLRRARAATAQPVRWPGKGSVSLDDMSDMISELTPSLRETAMVTSPQTHTDRGHIWASPCGKRVYIN